MEKKFKFTDNPNMAKTIYGIVVAILCITAIVIGIVAANSKKNDNVPTPTPDDSTINEPEKPDNNDQENPPEDEPEEPQKLTFISPVTGTVTKKHSLTIPVFSTTLEEWRVHAGIDISTKDAAPVFAVAKGEVTKVYNHPMLGTTVEITHEGGITSVYSNLSSDGSSLISVGTEVESGDQIGVVGDTSISELAEETHLHFEMMLNNECIDPLSYISEESKEASLGITIDN